MQRAAASTPPTTPQTSNDPPSKRRKLSNDPSPTTTPSADTQAFQAAADAEDAKRAAAIERLAAEAGETKWVLSTVDTGRKKGKDEKLRVLRTGYSDIDQDTQVAGWGRSLGRRKFGRFGNDVGMICLLAIP